MTKTISSPAEKPTVEELQVCVETYKQEAAKWQDYYAFAMLLLERADLPSWLANATSHTCTPNVHAIFDAFIKQWEDAKASEAPALMSLNPNDRASTPAHMLNAIVFHQEVGDLLGKLNKAEKLFSNALRDEIDVLASLVRPDATSDVLAILDKIRTYENDRKKANDKFSSCWKELIHKHVEPAAAAFLTKDTL